MKLNAVLLLIIFVQLKPLCLKFSVWEELTVKRGE